MFRNLTTGGFYAWKDIGYMANDAIEHFDGPPPEVLKHLILLS